LLSNVRGVFGRAKSGKDAGFKPAGCLFHQPVVPGPLTPELVGRILTLPPGKAAPGYSFLNLQGYDGKPAGLPYQSGAVSGCA
jgi:hypothetical protein